MLIKIVIPYFKMKLHKPIKQTQPQEECQSSQSELQVEQCSRDVEMARSTTWERKETFQVLGLRVTEAQGRQSIDTPILIPFFPYTSPSSYSFPGLITSLLDDFIFSIHEWGVEFVIVDICPALLACLIHLFHLRNLRRHQDVAHGPIPTLFQP